MVSCHACNRTARTDWQGPQCCDSMPDVTHWDMTAGGALRRVVSSISTVNAPPFLPANTTALYFLLALSSCVSRRTTQRHQTANVAPIRPAEKQDASKAEEHALDGEEKMVAAVAINAAAA